MNQRQDLVTVSLSFQCLAPLSCIDSTHIYLLQNKLFRNLGIGKSCAVQLEFLPSDGSDSGTVPRVQIKGKRGDAESLPLYRSKDTVRGHVKVVPVPGKRLEHLGIRVQLVGEIIMNSDKAHPHEIISLVRDLAPPGEMVEQATFPFEFKSVEMEYESYRGSQVLLQYSVRVIVARSMGQSLIQDHFFEVRNPISVIPPQESEVPIKMEVGIEDCLHIEFEYGRSSYHLSDTVVGKINFLLVRIKLKHMELEIKRRETVGGGMNARLESETIAKFEIMDGAPARGESIPIRLHLSPYPLTPSYDNVHNKFGVKYSINLVLVDEEDRRYFKQQEITMYRVDDAGKDSSWNFISDSMTHYLDETDEGSSHVIRDQQQSEPDAITTDEALVVSEEENSKQPVSENPGDIEFGDEDDMNDVPLD